MLTYLPKCLAPALDRGEPESTLCDFSIFSSFLVAMQQLFVILNERSAKTKLNLPRVPREVTPVEIPLAAERAQARSTSHGSLKQEANVFISRDLHLT